MRQPTPWFRKSKNAWFVELNGRQVRLGKHPDDAPQPRRTKTGWNAPPAIRDAFHSLMAGRPKPIKSNRLSVAQVSDLFLEHSAKHHATETYGLYRYYLQRFCETNGHLLAQDVVPHHVTAWLNAHPTWKNSRRHAALAVKRAFAFVVKEGLLSVSPLRSLEVEASAARTRVLTPEERKEILASVRDQSFKDFLFAMLETGCRPSEVAKVTAQNVRLDQGLWIFQHHKSSKKTKAPRVVYLNPAMVELTRRLIAQYPEGPLFRSPRGKRPFTRNGIRCRFRRLRKKLPHLGHFVCYTLRHTYATTALVNGVGVAQVAELLGHRDVAMVQKHYGHLSGQSAHLREAAIKATA